MLTIPPPYPTSRLINHLPGSSSLSSRQAQGQGDCDAQHDRVMSGMQLEGSISQLSRVVAPKMQSSVRGKNGRIGNWVHGAASAKYKSIICRVSYYLWVK